MVEMDQEKIHISWGLSMKKPKKLTFTKSWAETLMEPVSYNSNLKNQKRNCDYYGK